MAFFVLLQRITKQAVPKQSAMPQYNTAVWIELLCYFVYLHKNQVSLRAYLHVFRVISSKPNSAALAYVRLIDLLLRDPRDISI